MQCKHILFIKPFAIYFFMYKTLIIKTLLILLASSNITIDDATSDECIYGYADRQLNLTCRISNGNPKASVYWKYNNSVVQRSNSSTVTYSFQLSTAHNLGEFSCETNNSILSQQNIKICLYRK